MMDKITINDAAWFYTTHFKGKKQLSPASEISLKVSPILYPLPVLLEGMFFLCLVFLAILPFIDSQILPPIPFFLVYTATVPSYLLLRYLLIKHNYQLSSGLDCLVSKSRVEIPASRIIDEPNGRLTLERNVIEKFAVYYWPNTRDAQTHYAVTEFQITTNSGKCIRLTDSFFPLKQMLYLLVYFDYPLTFIKKRWSVLHMFRVIFLSLPVMVHIAVTGFLFKEYFL